MSRLPVKMLRVSPVSYAYYTCVSFKLLAVLFFLPLGGMQDYNYLYGNCMEVTFELSCCKHPRATELRKEWDLNRESLLAYMEKVNPSLNIKVTTIMTISPLQTAILLLFMCSEKLFDRVILEPFQIFRVLSC